MTQDSIPPFSSLYEPAVLGVMRDVGWDVESLLCEMEDYAEEPIKRYPDGSIQIDGIVATEAFWEAVRPLVMDRVIQQQPKWGPKRTHWIIETARFEPLQQFPYRMLTLTYWGEWARAIEGSISIGGPRRGVLPSLPASPLENLNVSLAFHRKLTKSHKRQLASVVSGWLKSVEQQGMFGEGPIRPKSLSIGFARKFAQFQVDASCTGQNTVNWLLLSLLRICPLNLMVDVRFSAKVERAIGNLWKFEIVDFADVYGPIDNWVDIPMG